MPTLFEGYFPGNAPRFKLKRVVYGLPLLVLTAETRT